MTATFESISECEQSIVLDVGAFDEELEGDQP